MPSSLRETAEGGLAATPTGRRLEQEIFGSSKPFKLKDLVLS
jgi:L-serine dehydratase